MCKGRMTPPNSLALLATAGAERNGLKSYSERSFEEEGIGNGQGELVEAMMDTSIRSQIN